MTTAVQCGAAPWPLENVPTSLIVRTVHRRAAWLPGSLLPFPLLFYLVHVVHLGRMFPYGIHAVSTAEA